MLKKTQLFAFIIFSICYSKDPSNHSLLKIGTSKNLKGIEYKLVEAKQIDSNIHLKIEVKNVNRKNFNYSALLFHKLYDSKGKQIANIDPFQSKKSVVFDVKRGQSFISNLVYEIVDIQEPLQLSIVSSESPNFKSDGFIFSCRSSLDGNQLYFDLSNLK